MRKALVGPDARMLNHAEFVYGPGDRARTRRLFEAFGARVLDPQTDPIPEAVGPAAAPYLIIYFDGEADDPFDNVAYASEVQAPQRAFEEVLRARFDTDPELAAARDAFRAQHSEIPQATTHLGIALPSAEALDATMERLSDDPDLRGRVELSKVFRPDQPDSADPRVVQAFVHTDLCSNGLLCVGQRFELQVRLDL